MRTLKFISELNFFEISFYSATLSINQALADTVNRPILQINKMFFPCAVNTTGNALLPPQQDSDNYSHFLNDFFLQKDTLYVITVRHAASPNKYSQTCMGHKIIIRSLASISLEKREPGSGGQ